MMDMTLANRDTSAIKQVSRHSNDFNNISWHNLENEEKRYKC